MRKYAQLCFGYNNTQTSKHNLNHYPSHANNQKLSTQNKHISTFDLLLLFFKNKPNEKVHYLHGFSLVLYFDFLHSKQALTHKHRIKSSQIDILVEFLSCILTSYTFLFAIRS